MNGAVATENEKVTRDEMVRLLNEDLVARVSGDYCLRGLQPNDERGALY
jgi:hypothetical protein